MPMEIQRHRRPLTTCSVVHRATTVPKDCIGAPLDPSRTSIRVDSTYKAPIFSITPVYGAARDHIQKPRHVRLNAQRRNPRRFPTGAFAILPGYWLGSSLPHIVADAIDGGAGWLTNQRMRNNRRPCSRVTNFLFVNERRGPLSIGRTLLAKTRSKGRGA